MPQRIKPPPRHAGFSAIELTIVVLTIGIFAAVAVPRYARSLCVRQVDMAARRIAADFDLARREARMVSATRQVTFSPSLDQYTLDSSAGLDRGSETYTVLLREAPYQVDLVSATFEGTSIATMNGFGVLTRDGEVVVQAGNCIKKVIFNKTNNLVTIE